MSKRDNGAVETAQRPAPPAGYEDASTSIPFYQPAACGDFPAHIDVVGITKMPTRKGVGPDGKPHKPWYVITGILVDASLGVERDGNIVEMAPGDKIAVSITEQLKDVAMRVLSNPTKVLRVWLCPKGKIKTSSGQPFWDWQVSFGPVQERETPLLSDAIAYKALGAGDLEVPVAPNSQHAVS